MLLRDIFKVCASLAVVLTLVHVTKADDNDDAKLYRAEFINIQAQTKGILLKADQLVKAAPTDRSIPNLRQEIHALRGNVDNLRQRSVQSNLDEIKNGELSSKTFLVVSIGCEEIAFVLRALDSFLDTRDPDFLSWARRGQIITQELENTIATVDADSSALYGPEFFHDQMIGSE